MANVAINVIIAIVTFMVALGIDFYIIKSFPIFIEAITTDAVLQAICYAGMIVLMIGATLIAPYLAIVSSQERVQ